MATLKTLTIAAALIAGATSLAIAQGPPTGGYPPVAGGAAASPIPGGAAPTGKSTHHKTTAKHPKKSQEKPM
jgi:hypothetical protein